MLSRIHLGRLSLWRWLAIVAALAGIGFAAGFFARQPTVNDLNDNAKGREAQLAAARQELAQREGQRQTLEASVAQVRQQAADLQRQLDAKAKEVDTLRGAGEQVANLERRVASLTAQLQDASKLGGNAARIREVVASLEVDRLLLADMRKDPPTVRTDAEQFWASVKEVAVKSNPSLSSKVDKIRASLPVYFNWAEQQYASERESQLTYRLTGASNYDAAIQDFWGAALLVVIERIDVLAGLIS